MEETWVQLPLLEVPNALRERFGEGFFRSLPARPAVYVMSGRRRSGEELRVLYVGKSVNLRARLGSYKNARPDRSPRKVLRLVALVETITWEPCTDEESALLRENELLRLHQPPFNRIGARPQAYGGIALRATRSAFELRLLEGSASGSDRAERKYGLFRASRFGAFAALRRLLLAAVLPPRSWAGLPLGCFSSRVCREFSVPHGGMDAPCLVDLPGLVEMFMTGESPALLDWLGNGGATAAGAGGFENAWRARDLETLTSFYDTGPKRLRLLRKRHGLGDRLVTAAELDDLGVVQPRLRASHKCRSVGFSLPQSASMPDS